MTGLVCPFPIPERAAFPPFVQWTGDNRFLSPPECDAIIEIAEAGPMVFGSIGNGDNPTALRVDKDYRCVRTRGLGMGEAVDWLFEKARQRIGWANTELYRFDLTGIEEGMQFLRYDAPTDAEPAGRYNWHQDFGGGPSSKRKLSLIVQLSDPEDYEGGDLHLFTDRDFVPAFKARGEAVLFPSWTPHMVSPITKGTRYALATWVCGPQLR